MARKRNPETIAKIADAAWKLFGERGYNATSYADISNASGINRATVQHYFPRKEMMATLNLQRLRSCAATMANDVTDPDAPAFTKLYVLGQIYLAALTSCDASRAFLCDVLENRALTEDTISADFDWSIEYVLGSSFDEGSTEDRDDMVVAMGGLYELMFCCIRQHRTLGIPKRLAPAFREFAHLAGYSEADCAKMLERHAIASDKLDALGLEAYRRSFEVAVVECEPRA